jgi:hypothetical protein
MSTIGNMRAATKRRRAGPGHRDSEEAGRLLARAETLGQQAAPGFNQGMDHCAGLARTSPDTGAAHDAVPGFRDDISPDRDGGSRACLRAGRAA